MIQVHVDRSDVKCFSRVNRATHLPRPSIRVTRTEHATQISGAWVSKIRYLRHKGLPHCNLKRASLDLKVGEIVLPGRQELLLDFLLYRGLIASHVEQMHQGGFGRERFTFIDLQLAAWGPMG